MSPEQRAAKLYPEGTIDHAVNRERVARSIRSAENAALERAAVLAERNDRGEVSPYEIRSLKSRTPRPSPRRKGAK